MFDGRSGRGRTTVSSAKVSWSGEIPIHLQGAGRALRAPRVVAGGPGYVGRVIYCDWMLVVAKRSSSFVVVRPQSPRPEGRVHWTAVSTSLAVPEPHATAEDVTTYPSWRPGSSPEDRGPNDVPERDPCLCTSGPIRRIPQRKILQCLTRLVRRETDTVGDIKGAILCLRGMQTVERPTGVDLGRPTRWAE